MPLPMKWDLSPLCANYSKATLLAQLDEAEKAHQQFVNTWRKADFSDPTNLASALKDYEVLLHTWDGGGSITHYIGLKSALDESDPAIKAAENLIAERTSNLTAQIRFFELTLGKISTEQQALLLKAPSLAAYRFFLQQVFAEAKHRLSEAEENILQRKEQAAHSNWVRLTSELLTSQEREIAEVGIVNFGNLLSRMSDPKKTIRDSAAAQLNQMVKEVLPVAEAEINSILANKKINDDLQGFTLPEEARLLADTVQPATVSAMTDTVAKHYDLVHQIYELLAKLHGVAKLAYHERSLPYALGEKKFLYPDGVDLVRDVLDKLDPEFSKITDIFSKKGQIDVYPAKGKYSGGFCSPGLPGEPIYILLNYTNQLQDVLTLAHEVGHGIHDELMRGQNALYYHTSLATAEVSSTFMEDFVLERLLETAEPEMRLGLLMNKLQDDANTIFRQVACYRFEQELHKAFRAENYLDAKRIGEIFQKEMIAYMGPFVSQDPGVENWWVYWPHIRIFFYTYSYASGLLISKALQHLVKNDGGEIEKVKRFMAAGKSDTAENIFAHVGLDITRADFWENSIAEIKDLLEQTKTLAKELGKI